MYFNTYIYIYKVVRHIYIYIYNYFILRCFHSLMHFLPVLYIKVKEKVSPVHWAENNYVTNIAEFCMSVLL